MRTCSRISPDQLYGYAVAQVAARPAARVRAHLESGCGRCAGRIQFWRRSFRALSAAHAPEPPGDVLNRAILLFRQRGPKPSLLQRVAAALSFDSRLQPVLVGARDTAGTSVHLGFDADAARVDLMCEPDLRSPTPVWRMIGQALAADDGAECGWRVCLEGASGRVETRTDATGEFGFEGISPGGYQLALRDLKREIVLPRIELERL
jgi:hypothetical protein